MTVEIGGHDRFKFFKRPVVPTMEDGTQTAGAPLALASNRPTIHRALQPRSQLLQTDARGSIVPAKPRTLDPVPKRPLALRATADESPSSPNEAAADVGTREMGCQTLYRENDCQTDPYTPDSYIEEGNEPEPAYLIRARS